MIQIHELERITGPTGADIFVALNIGFVDYIDRFQKRHRAGYGFRYDLSYVEGHALYEHRDRTIVRVAPDDRNLTFVSELGYSYDRERVHGEGNDWE